MHSRSVLTVCLFYFNLGDVETRTLPGEQSAISARLLNQKGFCRHRFPLQVRVIEFRAGPVALRFPGVPRGQSAAPGTVLGMF